MISYWGLGMPLGAGLGLGLGWGPQGMWAGLIVGLTAAALLMGARPGPAAAQPAARRGRPARRHPDLRLMKASAQGLSCMA